MALHSHLRSLPRLLMQVMSQGHPGKHPISHKAERKRRTEMSKQDSHLTCTPSTELPPGPRKTATGVKEFIRTVLLQRR